MNRGPGNLGGIGAIGAGTVHVAPQDGPIAHRDRNIPFDDDRVSRLTRGVRGLKHQSSPTASEQYRGRDRSIATCW